MIYIGYLLLYTQWIQRRYNMLDMYLTQHSQEMRTKFWWKNNLENKKMMM